MSEKTMRKWLKTFLMLLPVAFMGLFGIYLINNPITSVDGEGSKIAYENVEYYEYNDVLIIDAPIQYTGNEASFEFDLTYDYVASSQVFGIDGSSELGYATVSIDNNIISTLSMYVDNNVLFESNTFVSITPLNLNDSNIDATTSNEYLKTLKYEVSLVNENEMTPASMARVVIYYRPEASNNDILVKSYTTVDTNNPVSVMWNRYDEFVDETMGQVPFNFDSIYDWVDSDLFNGNAPRYVKPVFHILVYEVIIEILFLFFSFFTFVIRFAQHWIDGFYEKGRGR